MGDEFAAREIVARDHLDSVEISVLFEAVAVAMLAKTSGAGMRAGRADTMGLTLDRVDNLRVRAEEQLPRGHDLRAAIFSFATMYEELRYDAGAVVKLGEALDGACARILNPAPKERFRADIDG